MLPVFILHLNRASRCGLADSTGKHVNFLQWVCPYHSCHDIVAAIEHVTVADSVCLFHDPLTELWAKNGWLMHAVPYPLIIAPSICSVCIFSWHKETIQICEPAESLSIGLKVIPSSDGWWMNIITSVMETAINLLWHSAAKTLSWKQQTLALPNKRCCSFPILEIMAALSLTIAL